MPFLPRIPSLLRNLMRRRKVEQDLADEVSSYVDLSTQRKMKEGLNEPAARRAALVEFGGIEQVKEQVREVRLGSFSRDALTGSALRVSHLAQVSGFLTHRRTRSG